MAVYFKVTITVKFWVCCKEKCKRWGISSLRLHPRGADSRTVFVQVCASPVDRGWPQTTAVCQHNSSSSHLFLFTFAFLCFLPFPSRKKYNEVLLAECCQYDCRYPKYSWLRAHLPAYFCTAWGHLGTSLLWQNYLPKGQILLMKSASKDAFGSLWGRYDYVF